MIVSCGEALIDVVPPARPGGAPLNVAIAAARLGVTTAFAGRLSTDEYGQMLRHHLAVNGVDDTLLETGPEPTALAVVKGSPPTFRFEGEHTADMRLEELDLSRLPAGPHVLHGGGLGLFRGRTADVLAGAADAHDGMVSLDPNVRPQIVDDRDRWLGYHDKWLQNTSVYKASTEDLDWIWPGRPPEAVADELLDRGVQLIAVTYGAEGAEVYTSTAHTRAAGVSAEVADTVGAGDTFVASLLTSLVEVGADENPARIRSLPVSLLERMLDRAVAAAALACERVGADPPRRDQLPPSLQVPLLAGP